MEYSGPIETKTFTIPVHLLEETQHLPDEVVIDKLSELLLEFFEDGKYAYSPYQKQNKPVPETHKQQKMKIKKYLKTLQTPKYCPQSFKGKVHRNFFNILINSDDTIVPHLIQRNAELRKVNREYKTELNEIKPLYEDLKGNFDVKIDCEMQKEIQSRLEKTMKEERAHVLEQLKERLNIINKLEEENVKLREYHTADEERLISDNVRMVEEVMSLKEQLKKAQEKLEKKNIGRPKLSKKEKKKLKKEKLKKQLEELESSDSESDSESE